jgi:hypothetical protein
MASLEAESSYVKEAEWFTTRKGGLGGDYPASVARNQVAKAVRDGLRNVITDALPGLAALDRHGDWSAQQIATARALIAQMEEAARQLDAEKGRELRARLSPLIGRTT